MDRLLEMFTAQEELQRKAYKIFPRDMTVEDAIEYIRINVLAATDELHEALGEVDWKPWAHGKREVRKDAFIGELIDVWHFLMNLVLAAGYDAEEASVLFYDRYVGKCEINERRQLDGYDGRSTKCGACGRALDDPAVTCRSRVREDGTVWDWVCESNLTATST